MGQRHLKDDPRELQSKATLFCSLPKAMSTLALALAACFEYSLVILLISADHSQSCHGGGFNQKSIEVEVDVE